MAILLFVIILLVLVIGHEFGHFSIAKWVGMRVDEFGVGFPPRLFAWKRGETEYSINLLPFGGFVKIFGEDATPEAEIADEYRAFTMRSRWAQAGVLVAGPFSNIILGFLALWIAYMVGVPAIIQNPNDLGNLTNPHVVIAEVLPHSPAASVGLLVGDTVTMIDGQNVDHPEDIPRLIGMYGGSHVVTLLRDGDYRSVAITPVTGLIPQDPDRFGIGVATALVGNKVLGPIAAFGSAAIDTVTGLWSVLVGLWTMIAGLFTLSASLNDISGPVGIASLVGDAAAFGVGQVLMLAAVISLNLAVLNLLPFPALDGGRLAVIGVEALIGRAVSQRTQQVVNAIGFIVLIGLMIVVTIHDVSRLVL